MPMTDSAVSLPISLRLEAFRQERRVRAGSLIITVFGDAILPRGGRIWLGSLIRLLEPLAVSERLVRTSVFRLVKAEWLQTETHGRRADYMITASGRERFEEAARLVYAPEAPRWDRQWRLVFLIGDLHPKEREQLRRSFFWQGFGMLGPDCFVHPGADLKAALGGLAAEGPALEPGLLMPMLAAEAASPRAASARDLVRRAWNLEELAAAYSGFVSTYQPIREQLADSDGAGIKDEEAFLLRILLIHDYRRLLLRDPDLPEELLPNRWPGKAARQLCREIYRLLVDKSERYLNGRMQLANGSTPPAGNALASRFAA